ncbi:MAG TPA: Rieske (2Fe-2S) protein [Actinomycetes bacterium]
MTDQTEAMPIQPAAQPPEPAGPTDVLRPAPSRRQVLAVAAAVGAGGLVAACGGTGSSSGPADSGNGSTSGATSGSPSGSTSDGGSTGSLAKTADVPVGGGEVLADQKIVLTQPQAGTFKAFSAICTHQGCTVGSVSGGTINCPCHGSQFSAADGSVKNGPATAPLREIAVKVEGGSIVKA